jgi:hypothetical protein
MSPVFYSRKKKKEFGVEYQDSASTLPQPGQQ